MNTKEAMRKAVIGSIEAGGPGAYPRKNGVATAPGWAGWKDLLTVCLARTVLGTRRICMPGLANTGMA